MAESHFKVSVEGDHIQRLTSAKPVPALAEIVWNALDADATSVEVDFKRDELGMQAIIVRDDGHGIARDEVERLFGKLGGSWKRHGNRSKTKGRILHGKEGKGRFKALALGRTVDWVVAYQDERGTFRYTITIIRDDLVDVRVSEETRVDDALGTGVEVIVSELDAYHRSLEPKHAVQPLSELFALYLTDYSDASVLIEGEKLDPESAIAERTPFTLTAIKDGEKTYDVALELIEWSTASERWVFLCDDEGFPYHRVTPKYPSAGFHFSAYIKTPLVEELQTRGTLDLVEMSPAIQSALDEAAEVIKGHFKDKEAAAAVTEIDKWKEEKVYPYRGEPRSSVEVAERKVFEIVALNVNRHLPDFSTSASKTKAFQLRMLKTAIEQGPEEVQHILTEVLNLPRRKQKELSKLLREADLANVITASKRVADRLKFVHGLEAILFDPDTKKVLKERSQLHRILADNNTWIFGEEYNLTVDDQSLTEVLRKHRKLIGEDTVIDHPVTKIDGKKGIVDLMLSRSVPKSRPEEREHLIIELKRPAKAVGATELTQIETYAMTIAEDERFRHIDTRWTFWVISNDLDAFARKKTRQEGQPRGQTFRSGNVQVMAKTWSEIIAESKARMNFVQEKLKANVDREHSLAYLQRTYDKYLKGVSEAEESEDTEEAA